MFHYELRLLSRFNSIPDKGRADLCKSFNKFEQLCIFYKKKAIGTFVPKEDKIDTLPLFENWKAFDIVDTTSLQVTTYFWYH